MIRSLLLPAVLLLCTTPCLPAADLIVLSNDNWSRFAPEGKEVDCILGDYAMRSDRLMVVVAQPLPSRHANMTVRQVGGAVIDLTVTDRPNDQLSAFYPGKRQQVFSRAEIVVGKGKKVILRCLAPARPATDKPKRTAEPEVTLDYELEDGQGFLLIRSRFKNTLETPIDLELTDEVRADNFDAKVKPGPTNLFWVHDKHFEQAYSLAAEKHSMRTRSDLRVSTIEYLPGTSATSSIRLAPGQSHELVRRLFPGPHLLGVKGEAAKHDGQALVRYGLHLVDPAFKPVAGAEITLKQNVTAANGEVDEIVYGTGRSDDWGWIKADLPLEKYQLVCKSVGRATLEKVFDLTGYKTDDVVNTEYELEHASMVFAKVTDDQGQPIPCKVAFKGTGGTRDPNWGPPQAREAVVNLFHSANGLFSVAINTGTYEAIISHGPEFDVARIPLKIGKGERVPLKATLRRAYATPGWVSADFHSHSSPSGDNTSDQRGRVLNLLCEDIQFAPCTEHNRVDSYLPHLQALGVEKLMGTCSGIELTGTPLPLQHHNAFPLKMFPRTQDNGAPLTDLDPATQIRRLAEWDDKSEKLVQQNHPDIGWLFFHRKEDGKPEGDFKAGFPFMHVIEVHPIHEVLSMDPKRIYVDTRGKRMEYNHTIFNWLQLLNQGYRIPGVVNTDAHYNFHGSGGLRNFVRCDTKVPGEIDPLQIVRDARKGHLVMSNGPFLEVKLNGALPGDDIRLSDGKGTLQVRVSCPNWFDIDRVQVLLNGRVSPELNFTRQSHPTYFGKSALRFEANFPVAIAKDTHVIVVAVGERATLGEVMGPMWGRHNPVALTNPIYVDVDGNGFQHNGDTLGQPLPIRSGIEVK